MSKLAALKESAEERCRLIRDACDLISCLTVQFEIELGLGSIVVPVAKRFELTPSQATLRDRTASNRDAHARRLPDDAAFICEHSGGGNEPARDETGSALILASEDKDHIAFGDLLAAIHRLLRIEHECLRPRIFNLGFDHKRHAYRSVNLSAQ